MQLGVQLHILTQLLLICRTVTVFDMYWLPRIENCTQEIRSISFKRYGFSKSPCNYFTVQLILDAIIQEDRASFNFKQITHHLDKPWQIKLNVIVEWDVFSDEEQRQCILQCCACLQEEVVFRRSIPHHLGHECYHSFFHHMCVESFL